MELQKQGCTIVLVSHDIEFCAQTADRVCLLFDGETATVQKTADYFTGNEFYTTAAARIAKNIVKDAFTVRQVLEAYGVKPTKRKCRTRNSTDKAKTKKNDKDEGESEKVNHDIDKTGSADEGNTDKGIADKAETATPSSSISLLRKIGLVLTFLVMAFCFYKTVSQEDLTRLISGWRGNDGRSAVYLPVWHIYSGDSRVYRSASTDWKSRRPGNRVTEEKQI